MKLVIVESPTKAKTLSRFLGEGYEVESSKGHVVDLPQKDLGIEISHNFDPQYVVIPSKKTVLAALRKSVQGAQEVYLATDPDREGEAIAWHLAEHFGDVKGSTSRVVSRVSFHEITESAVKEAFAHPRAIDEGLVNSQQARRVLDRLVGYKLSPLLWKKVRFGLSAGRVQSVAVRLVVERERERQAFKSEEYWEIEAELSKQPKISFRAKLAEKAGKKVTIASRAESEVIAAELRGKDYLVTNVEKSTRKRSPYPPFTTSSLQQAGVNVLGFSAKRTMRSAQALYEAGLITYHRTDSTTMSASAFSQIREYIAKHFNSSYLPTNPIQYKTKVRLAQEAHEAIRPTDAGKQASEIDHEVGSDERKVYELVWHRAITSQMNPALYEQTGAQIGAGNYLLRAQGSKRVFDGWEVLNGPLAETGELPALSSGDKLALLNLLPSQHFTEPPARYTEATLIKKLEEEGIGRPSTYAPILSAIQDRGYILKDGKALKPEDVGVVVNDILVDYFPDVVDPSFTARLEEGLDEIAAGKKEWVELVAGFYGPFSRELEKAMENIDKSSITTLAQTEEKCPDCGSPLVLKLGRFGKFYSCTGFPKCKFARPYMEKIGMACPGCKDGEVIIKRTKRGKSFYGCSRYPNCKWASWKDPRKPESAKEETPS